MNEGGEMKSTRYVASSGLDEFVADSDEYPLDISDEEVAEKPKICESCSCMMTPEGHCGCSD